MEYADLEMLSKSTEGYGGEWWGFVANGTFVTRGISRWRRSRKSYKVFAVCEIVAAREAAGI